MVARVAEAYLLTQNICLFTDNNTARVQRKITSQETSNYLLDKPSRIAANRDSTVESLLAWQWPEASNNQIH